MVGAVADFVAALAFVVLPTAFASRSSTGAVGILNPPRWSAFGALFMESAISMISSHGGCLVAFALPFMRTSAQQPLHIFLQVELQVPRDSCAHRLRASKTPSSPDDDFARAVIGLRESWPSN